MTGPTAIAAPGDPADHPVRQGPVLPLVVGRGQGGDRGDHEHRAEPFHQRPAEQQHVQVRAQRGRQRAETVDGKADRERAVATPDVTELRPHQHECGHDQRVGGDRALDAGDGGVQVDHDLRDRDVHDARVEHHHELRRSEDDQGKPAAHRAILPRRAHVRDDRRVVVDAAGLRRLAQGQGASRGQSATGRWRRGRRRPPRCRRP